LLEFGGAVEARASVGEVHFPRVGQVGVVRVEKVGFVLLQLGELLVDAVLLLLVLDEAAEILEETLQLVVRNVLVPELRQVLADVLLRERGQVHGVNGELYTSMEQFIF